MPEEVVEASPDQMSLGADTPAEVHYGAVHEFDRLPDGYAKVIQPMRPYSDAEEWALNKSMELYGFIGTIVSDQYGRILDGNQRERVARLRGLGVPHTISHVRDDAHAIEIARAANAVRRHYTPEQRQELAPILRDQGFSYRAIAEALGVGKSTVYRDVFGELRLHPESVTETEIVPNGTLSVVTTESPTEDLHPIPTDHAEIVPNGTLPEINHAERNVEAPPAEPPQRVKRKGGGTYPAQRPTAPQTPIDLEDRLPRIRDMVRDCLSKCRTGGEIRSLSKTLVLCARMLEDRAKQLKVLPYNSLTHLPALLTDNPMIDQEPSEAPAPTE
jgi:hypothetical protein